MHNSIDSPRLNGSAAKRRLSVIFVRRPLGGMGFADVRLFTRPGTEETHCCDVANQHSLQLFYALSSHRLNMDGCWLGA